MEGRGGKRTLDRAFSPRARQSQGSKGDGRDVRPLEVLGDEGQRGGDEQDVEPVLEQVRRRRDRRRDVAGGAGLAGQERRRVGGGGCVAALRRLAPAPCCNCDQAPDADQRGSQPTTGRGERRHARMVWGRSC